MNKAVDVADSAVSVLSELAGIGGTIAGEPVWIFTPLTKNNSFHMSGLGPLLHR